MGARGSIRRARSRSTVMSETCTCSDELRMNPPDHVHVAGDERTLGDDVDAQSRMVGDDLEQLRG